MWSKDKEKQIRKATRVEAEGAAATWMASGIRRAEKARPRAKGGSEAGKGYAHSTENPAVPVSSEALILLDSKAQHLASYTTSCAHILHTAL